MSTSWWQEYFTNSRIHIWVIMLITFRPQHPAWHILPWQNIANKVDAFSSILVWFLCVLSLKLMVPSAIESTLSWQWRPTAMPFIAYITTNHKEVLHNWQPYVIFWELCCSLLHGILLSFFWFGRTLWLKVIWGGKKRYSVCISTAQSIIKESQGNNSRQKPGSRNRSRGHGVKLFTSFLLRACSFYFVM